MFFRRRGMTISREPDVRPMIGWLYSCLRATGAQPIEAGTIAVGLVIDDLMRHITIGVIDEQILERVMIMQAMAADTERLNAIMQGRARILFWFNVGNASLLTLLLTTLLYRFFF